MEPRAVGCFPSGLTLQQQQRVPAETLGRVREMKRSASSASARESGLWRGGRRRRLKHRPPGARGWRDVALRSLWSVKESLNVLTQRTLWRCVTVVTEGGGDGGLQLHETGGARVACAI